MKFRYLIEIDGNSAGCLLFTEQETAEKMATQLSDTMECECSVIEAEPGYCWMPNMLGESVVGYYLAKLR